MTRTHARARWCGVLGITLAMLAGGFLRAESCSVDRRPRNGAEMAEALGNKGKALQLYRELARQEPNELRWKVRAIDLEIRERHATLASDEADRLLSANPKSSEALLAVSLARSATGRAAAAMAAEQQAISADACDGRIVLQQSDLQGLEGHHVLAARTAEVAHRLAPLDFHVQQRWASTRPVAEQPAAYDALLSAFPGMTGEQSLRGRMLANKAKLMAASPCTVVPAASPTVVALDDPDLNVIPGFGVTVSLNGHTELMQLRTEGTRWSCHERSQSTCSCRMTARCSDPIRTNRRCILPI